MFHCGKLIPVNGGARNFGVWWPKCTSILFATTHAVNHYNQGENTRYFNTFSLDL